MEIHSQDVIGRNYDSGNNIELIYCYEINNSSDYMVPEIYLLYIALIFHGILWSLALRVLDHVKQGGSLKNFVKTEISVKENNDVIEDEDQDVENERNLVRNYMERY